MASNKTKNLSTYLFIVLTVAGIVLACSSIITNDYMKLVIVMVTLAISLFGIMKSLSNPSEEKNEVNEQ
ncbi:MAG: hypothetical protein LUE98_18500 [Tannerellaceae bacterium]|nr:hypothetical protein [Tannerellaceae bacterium]